MKHFLTRVKEYFRGNLGVPFIIVFQMLLLVCADLLIQGKSVLADEVAVFAYYLLLIGVVLQLVSFLRHGKQDLEENEK